MASTRALAIMREEALNRLDAVAGRLLGARGLTPSAYTGLSKDKDIATVRMIEAVAGDLEQLEEAAAEKAEGESPKAEPKAAAKGKKG